MDFNLLDHHHSKSQSEEINDTAARSYGCIFCKRGFTSAQALGGHMNIHRKDRNPKTNPNSSSSSNSFVPPIMSSDYNYVSYNPPNYNYRPPLYHEPYIELPVSARTSHYSFPASQEVRSTSLEAADDEEDGRVINRGFSDNEGLVWGQTLNLQAGPLRIHGGGAAVSSEEDDVDLELRLGYA